MKKAILLISALSLFANGIWAISCPNIPSKAIDNQEIKLDGMTWKVVYGDILKEEEPSVYSDSLDNYERGKAIIEKGLNWSPTVPKVHPIAYVYTINDEGMPICIYKAFDRQSDIIVGVVLVTGKGTNTYKCSVGGPLCGTNSFDILREKSDTVNSEKLSTTQESKKGN